MIHIEINTDNAAFADDPNVEVGRILYRLAQQFSDHIIDPDDNAEPLMDINGNRVGKVWEVRS